MQSCIIRDTLQHNTAFVFPGQGSQFAGMGRDVADKYPVARRVFDDIDAALGFSISRLCFDGPEEQLKLTQNTQPAILAVSSAIHAVLEDLGATRRDLLAGHSLGEYSAIVSVGGLTPAEAAKIDLKNRSPISRGPLKKIARAVPRTRVPVG